MRSTWGALLGLTSILFAPILPVIGQDVVMPTDAGVTTIDGGSSYSGSAQIGPEGSYLYFRKDIDNGVGYREGFSTVGGFVPLMLSPNYGLFGQGQFFVTDDGRFGGNIGGGARYFVESANRLFGVYGFMDFDENFANNNVEQFGFGFETLGTMWDFRANGYIPTDTDHQFMRLNQLLGPPVFSGNTILLNGNAFFERSMGGGDAEFGVPLLDPSAFGRLRAYFGGYAYDAEEEAQIGGRVRLESHVNEHITLGAAFMHDDVNGDMVTMAVDIRSWRSSLPNLNNRSIDNRAKLYLPVVRQYRIANDRFLKNITAPALDANGDQFNIVWVDNSNTGAGDGTFENPFTTLPATAPGAQYVLVRTGDSTETNPVLGGITLADNQIMFGEGHDFSFEITGTTFGPEFAGTYNIDDILPTWNTNGTNHPFLSNAAGNVITMANNNQVAGFNILSSTGSGIVGTGISNFTLTDLTIGSTNAALGNGGAGILLTNVSGVGTIEDIELHNNALAGLWVDNTNTAALTLNVEGRSGVTPNVTGGAFGLIIDGDNSQITATVSNFQNSGSDDGLGLYSSNAAVVDVELTDGAFDDAAVGNGINMIANAGTLTFDFEDVTADGANLAGMNMLVTNAATFVGSISGTALGGSSFSDNGTDGIILTVDNADVVGNGLLFSQTTVNDNVGHGLNFDSINSSSFTTNFNDGTINDNDGNNISAFVDVASSMTINVDPSELNNAGLNGVQFDVLNGSSFTTNLTDVDILNSNLNGILGSVDTGSFAFVTVNNGLINNSGVHGIGITAQANSTVTTSISLSTINNNNQDAAGGDGINLLADDSTVNLNLFNSGVANTAQFGSQNNGVEALAANTGIINSTVFNTGLFNNDGDGFVAEAHDASTILASFSATLASGNAGNGVALDVDNGATLVADVSNGSDLSGNFGNGLLLVAEDPTTTATLTGSGFGSTFDNNSLNGVLVFADNVGSITANVVGGASDNGQGGIVFDIQDVATTVDLRVTGGFNDTSFNALNGVLFDVENSNITRLGVSNVVAEGNGSIGGNSTQTNGVRFDLRDSTIAAGTGVFVTSSILDSNLGSGLNLDLLNVIGADASDINISGNQLSTNDADGFRFVHTNTVDAAAETLLDVDFNNNFMESNGERGMNVLNRGDARTDLDAGFNTVNLNDLEGVYIVNTASETQSADFGAPLLANGAVTAVPRLDLNFSFNTVTENGTADGDTTVAAGGFVLRVGTSDALTFADDGAASYTTDGGTASSGRGGVVAVISGNTFTENEEADVWFDSFVSTVNPADTVGTWTDNNTNGVPGDDVFTITTYEQDPLARLDLVFQSNTGDELEATQGGASYSNPEGTFKSRTDPLAGEAADGVGPFGAANRERNAQRFAFRTGLPPTMAAGSTFLFPGAGLSSFRVQEAANVFTGGNGFILDLGPGVNALGVDAAGAAAGPAGGPSGIDFMPWGWSLLP